MKKIENIRQIEALISETYMYAVILALVILVLAFIIAKIIKYGGKNSTDHIKRRIWYIIIGVVTPIGFFLYNALYVSKFIIKPPLQAKFSNANIVATLIIIGVYIAVGLLTMVLCAMGMFDKTDVHLLALDTDKDNGNFTRLKNLKEAYIKTKGVNKKQFALQDTFFSANLHYYQFSPDYSNLSTFKELFNYGDTKYSNPERSAIADLLLTDNAKDFDLKHGYRAQTHLGSLLMYHSIIDDVKKK